MKHFSLEHFVEHKLLTLEGDWSPQIITDWKWSKNQIHHGWKFFFSSSTTTQQASQLKWNRRRRKVLCETTRLTWEKFRSEGFKFSSFFPEWRETEWGVCIWGISNHSSTEAMQSLAASSSTFVIWLGGKHSYAKCNTT